MPRYAGALGAYTAGEDLAHKADLCSCQRVDEEVVEGQEEADNQTIP